MGGILRDLSKTLSMVIFRTSKMKRQIDMRTREATIIRFLREEKPKGASVREMWEALQDPDVLGDHITLQAYHRVVNKMAERGKLEADVPVTSTSRMYRLADHLTPENALSLTDIEEALWTLSAPEALAMYLDALDYFESRQQDVLERAAEGLLDEDPVELVLEMLQDKLARLQESLADYLDPQTRDLTVGQEITARHGELATLVHSYYGISTVVFDLGEVDRVKSGQHSIAPDWGRVRDTLKQRVFGDRAIYFLPFASSTENHSFPIGASDGSTHAGIIRAGLGAEFVDEGGELVLAFNNSIAGIHLPESTVGDFEFPYHGVPMSRAALEDPNNRGMILARPWHPNLTDSEYEHMKKTALDVVQYRVDERVMLGTARALGNDRSRGSGRLLPRPRVHFRDGTVVPQEREFNHYNRTDEYGEMVREGIALSYSILRAVKDSERLVFAGAVKSTQLKTFSSLLNWYIARGSRRRFGKPIDPSWLDMTRAGHISDNHAMTRLLTAVGRPDGMVACSFAVLRPFPQVVSSLFRSRVADNQWTNKFEDDQRRVREERSRWAGVPHYVDNVDISEDYYVRMCAEADYVMFYVGHTGGNPSPALPRYEFIDSLRCRDEDDAKLRVAQKIKFIVEAISVTKLAVDADHNFLSDKRIHRIVPFVVYDAHEKCKVWGHKLESELKSAIVARLAEMKRVRGITVRNFTLVPLRIGEYLKRMHKAIDATDGESPQLPGVDHTDDD